MLFYENCIINKVEPSFIRVDADEVTYHMHIMLRYELEKKLINKEIKVSDLPEIWRLEMQKNLGISPKTDTEAVLQDIHWPSVFLVIFQAIVLVQ